MLFDLEIIPKEVTNSLLPYFSEEQISTAKKIIQQNQLAITFQKGHPGRYFILAGIVPDDKNHQTRITLKSSENNTKNISSLCDCNHWNRESHCSHSAALFLKYQLLQWKSKAAILALSDDQMPMADLLGKNNNGVHVLNYGTIIDGPHQFTGQTPSMNYSANKFSLTSGSDIYFPTPQKWKGQLAIHFKDSEGSDEHYFLLFSHLTEEGEHKKISLFEHLYLFDWDKGTIYFLHEDIRNFIIAIRENHGRLDFNDLLRETYDLRSKELCKLYYNDFFIDRSHAYQGTFSINIKHSNKKHYHSLILTFKNDDQNIIMPPLPPFLLINENGILETFKYRSFTVEFIQSLRAYLSQANESNVISVRGTPFKPNIVKIAKSLVEKELSESFTATSLRLTTFSNSILKTLILSLLDCFGEALTKYSRFDHSLMSIAFDLPQNTVLKGLSTFYFNLRSYDINIYFHNSLLKHWSPKIQFNRIEKGLNWFDMELDINEEDLKIIKSKTIENDLIETSNGILLISNDKKELLKVVRNYTDRSNSKAVAQADGKTKFYIPYNKSRIFELYELIKLGLKDLLTEEEIQFCAKLTTLTELPQYEIPDVNTTPRKYQIDGYNWVRFLYEHNLGACLADDMGLGKTLQSIMFIQSVYAKISKVLIICPVSILLNWQNEFEKFTNLKVHIYHGGDRKLPDDAKIIITSYGIIKKEVYDIFKDLSFDILILDEVQHIKNYKSLGSSSVRIINAKYKLCLTGTPVENNITEFYNILDLAVPGIWGQLDSVHKVTRKYNREFAKKIARPFILRRTKGQVLTDLPDKIDNFVTLEFSDREKEIYKQKLKSIKSKIANQPNNRKYGEILKGLLELRQLCLWQSLESELPTKVDYLMSNLEQITKEGHQIIIFSQFTSYLDRIQFLFDHKKWNYSRIDGTQSVKKRHKEVELFQMGKNQLFLISLKAGGVGLNLTAASYIFLMDPWWNPAVESQAIDRAYRIGQKNKLNVYRPIIKDTVEEKVIELQSRKKELFNDLMNEDDVSYYDGKLTMKDFEELLQSTE